MSSFLNKAKAKVEEIAERNQSKGNNTYSSGAGPHSSNVMNAGDPAVDNNYGNDPNSRVGGYDDIQSTGQYGMGQGPGSAATSDTYGSAVNNPGYNNPQAANVGPHSSNLMNKMDPRVDSDLDGRNDPTSRTGGYGQTRQFGDNYAQSGGQGGLGATDAAYGTQSGRAGQTGYAGEPGYTGQSGIGEPGYAGQTGRTGRLVGSAADNTGVAGAGVGNTYDNSQSANAGPHNSNLMNKLDPRYDSDRDHRNDPTSRVGGYGTQGGDYGHAVGIHDATTHPTSGGFDAGNTGGYGAGNTGTYGVDNTAGTAGGYGDNSYTPGSGETAKTAGPHNSNLLNKLDPRVDSDLDGSKTYGGNQTYR